MAKQTVNIGAIANDGTGDPLRTAFDKLNDNFDELYPDIVSVSTAGATITLDCNSQIKRTFTPSANIGAAKTWAISNATNMQKAVFGFTMTTLDIQTFPSDFFMSDARWLTGGKTWTPLDTGEYIGMIEKKLSGYKLTIDGPFT